MSEEQLMQNYGDLNSDGGGTGNIDYNNLIRLLTDAQGDSVITPTESDAIFGKDAFVYPADTTEKDEKGVSKAGKPWDKDLPVDMAARIIMKKYGTGAEDSMPAQRYLTPAAARALIKRYPSEKFSTENGTVKKAPVENVRTF